MVGDTTVQRPGKVAGVTKDEGIYTGPDRDAFVLGGSDPNYVQDARTRANTTANAAGLQQAQIANRVGTASSEAGARSAGAMTRANPAAAQVEASRQTGFQQGGLADRLKSFAGAPEGPSAAQATLQRGTNQALASQLAIARSGGGFGESGAALGRAGQQAAAIQANAATGAAQLRADEAARHADRSLTAYQAAGDVLGQQRAGTVQEGGLNLDAQAQRDAAALGWADRQQGGQALESDIQGRNYDMQQRAADFGLEAEKAALAGRSDYQRTVSDQYQAELQDAAEHRRQDRQRDKDWVEGAAGLVSSIGGFLSDVRAKTGITNLNTAGAYGDPSGDYAMLADQDFSMQGRRDAREARAARNRPDESGGGMLGKFLGMMSDEETKTDVKDFRNVGKYEYEYKDPERHGGGRYLGPMAQELEHLPGVVYETGEGKAVDSGRLTMANASELGELRREVELLKKGRR